MIYLCKRIEWDVTTRGGEWLMRDFARPRDLGFSLRARGILTFYVARARLLNRFECERETLRFQKFESLTYVS